MSNTVFKKASAKLCQLHRNKNTSDY